MRRFLLISLFATLLLSEMLDVKLGLGLGLSAKNALLYLIIAFVIYEIYHNKNKTDKKFKSINRWFLILIFYSVFSFVISSFLHVYKDVDRFDSFVALKGGMIDYYLFFVCFFFTLRNEKDVLLVNKAILFLVTCGTFISLLDYYKLIPLNLVEQRTDHRLSGPIGQPNQFAAFLIFFLPAYYAWFREPSLSAKMISGVAMFVGLVSLLLTGSRGGLFGLIAGSFISVYFLRRVISFKAVTKNALLALAGGVVALVYVYNKYADILDARVAQSTENGDASAGRFDIWDGALTIMKHNPGSFIWGNGWNSFFTTFHGSPHNTYLNFWFTLGLIGLIIYLTIIYLVIQYCANSLKYYQGKSREFLVAFLFGLCALSVHLFFILPTNPWLFFWSLIGLNCKLAYLFYLNEKAPAATPKYPANIYKSSGKHKFNKKMN